jgi:hypothetical protein
LLNQPDEHKKNPTLPFTSFDRLRIKGGQTVDGQGSFEHPLNARTGRDIPENQGVAKALKERL